MSVHLYRLLCSRFLFFILTWQFHNASLSGQTRASTARCCRLWSVLDLFNVFMPANSSVHAQIKSRVFKCAGVVQSTLELDTHSNKSRPAFNRIFFVKNCCLTWKDFIFFIIIYSHAQNATSFVHYPDFPFTSSDFDEVHNHMTAVSDSTTMIYI